jgi:hypothetical protein
MSITSEGTAARLGRLEAVEAIMALKARYWRAIDAGQPDQVEGCLAADLRVDFEGIPPFFDRASFMTMIREAATQPGRHMHHGRNPIIQVTGPTSAGGRWDIFYQGIFEGAGQIVQMVGEYEDEYRLEQGGWRIAAMTMRQRSFTVRAVAQDGSQRFTSLPGEGRLDNDAL